MQISVVAKGGMMWWRRGRFVVVALAIVINLLLFVAHIFRPTVEFSISAKEIKGRGGYAHFFQISKPVGFPYELPSDAQEGGSVSPLIVYEDGKALGPAHTVHSTIRAEGFGRFFHGRKGILFSSSDNTSPATNGRRYSARGQARVLPALWMPSVSFLVLVTIIVGFKYILAGLGFLFMPDTRRGRLGVVTPIIMLITLGVAVACVWGKWRSGQTLSLGVSGFLPVSDAHGYWFCSLWMQKGGASIFAQNHFMGDWCSRRLVHPGFLSGLLRLLDWSLPAVFMVEAGLIAASIGALGALALRRLGLAASMIVMCLLLDFARVHAFGLVMTEVSGLIAAVAAVALLISGSDSRRLRWVVLGLALFSVAMVARAGAMFVLPVLLVWAVWLAMHARKRFSLVVAGGCCLALSAGVLLQKSLIYILQTNGGASFGNFSTVLYRLSVGKDRWSDAYKDHPELFTNRPEAEAFRALYTIAFDNIKNHPEVIISTYLKEVARCIKPLLTFGHYGEIGSLLLLSVGLGVVTCVIRWRSPFYLLLLVVLIGELSSAPLLYADGGARIFAATVPFRALMVGVGVATLFEVAHRVACWTRLARARLETRQSLDAARFPTFVAACAGCSVPLIVMLPFTGLLTYAHVSPVNAIRCDDPLKAAVVQLDRETITFTVGKASSAPEVVPFRMPMERLIGGMPNNWFKDSFARLPADTMIIQGVNVSQADYFFMQPVDLIWRGDPPPSGATVSVCVDQSRITEVAGANYFEVVKLQVLSESRLPLLTRMF